MAYFEYKLNENVYIERNFSSNEYDGVIYILCPENRGVWPRTISGFLEKIAKLDENIHKNTTLVSCDYVSGDRLIIAGTGEITPYHSVKVIKEAAIKGMNKAIDAGVTKPLLIVQKIPNFEESPLVSILGALEALYVPIQIREFKNDKNFAKLGLYAEGINSFEAIVHNAINLENSRIVVRDIAGADPERMTPSKIVDYVKDVFKDDLGIYIDVVEDQNVIAKEYPLLAAVSRADNQVERHKPRVVKIEYNSAHNVKKTIGLVGKGVTYDTGGADIKTEGNMTGMSRDKTGAAVVAGFLKACSIFKPEALNVVGVMCLCRNSVGADSYVSDEMLISRSGKTVRVTNTDAEGRFAMADALYQLAESLHIYKDVSQIYTIATLTGHAYRTYGKNTAAIDNYHVSSLVKTAYDLQKSGSRFGEGIEVSLLRSEDFDANVGKCKGDDMVQISDSAKIRGHQIAAAFLVMIGGLDAKGMRFTHLDIAGSAGAPPDQPTTEPLISLCYLHDIFHSPFM